MTLRNEIMEFIQAYTAMRDVGFKSRDADRADADSASEREYRDAMTELTRARTAELQGESEATGRATATAARTRRAALEEGSAEAAATASDSWEATAEAAAASSPAGGSAGLTRDQYIERYDQNRDGVVDSSETYSAREELAATREFARDDEEEDPDPLAGLPVPSSGSAIDLVPGFRRGGLFGDRPRAEEDLPADPVTAQTAPRNLPLRPPAEATSGFNNSAPDARPDTFRRVPARPSALPAPDYVHAEDTGPAPKTPRGVQSGPMPESPRPTARPESVANATRIVWREGVDATQRTLRTVNAEIAGQGQAIGGAENVTGVNLETGEGGVSYEEYEALGRTIDPNYEMEPHIRNMAILAEVQRTGAAANMPIQDQDRLLAGILMTQYQQARVMGTLLVNAVESRGGVEGLDAQDMQLVSRMMNDAISFYPTGYNITLSPAERGGLDYVVENFDGTVRDSGVLDFAQTWEAIEGIASGRAHVDAMGEAIEAVKADTLPRTPEEAISVAAQARADFDDLNQMAVEYQGTNETLPEDVALSLSQARDRYLQTRQRAVQNMGIEARDFDAAVDAQLEVAIPSRMQPTPTPAPTPAPGAASAPSGAPQVGAIVDGYEYLGGPVNSRDSWRAVRN
jgi:hypothetical protein